MPSLESLQLGGETVGRTGPAARPQTKERVYRAIQEDPERRFVDVAGFLAYGRGWRWFAPGTGWIEAASRQTRESQNTQPLELRFRATLGQEQEVEVALVQRL